MNRADTARKVLLWSAIADEAKNRAQQARAQLEQEARSELDRDGVAPTWRIPGVGTVPLALTSDDVTIADEKAYIEWVHGRYPDEIEVIVTTRVRPAFDKVLRDGAAKRGAACDDEGTVIPGLVFKAGGQPRGVSVRASTDAKDAAAGLARAFLDTHFAAAAEVPGE